MTDLSAAPRPTVAPPSPWDFPVPQERLLPGGIRLLQHHLPGQHVLSVRVVIPVSLTDEPRDREGVASLMARLLDEGAGDYSSDELAEVLERHGIALGAGVAEGGLSVDLDVPSRFLPTALELLSLIVREPTFPEAEVRRMVKTRLAEIDQESASPPHLAMRHTIATLYAPHERASRPSAGGAATVAQLTRDDVEGWFRARVGPAGATFIVAGDLGEHDVPGLVEAAFASWVAPGHVAPSPARRPELARTAARVVLVDRPGSVQSEIVVACQGPDRSVEPGWAEYPVLAFILGGSPNARIDAVLREEKGYTYGIRAGFRPRPAGGLFITSGSVRAEVTAESVQILLGLLDGMREGVRPTEVTAAVDFISRTAPGRFATADAVADETSALAVERLPMDFPTTNLRRVESLTPELVDAAYARLGTVGWTVIVVGDADTLRGPLADLGVGPLSVVSAAGVVSAGE